MLYYIISINKEQEMCTNIEPECNSEIRASILFYGTFVDTRVIAVQEDRDFSKYGDSGLYSYTSDYYVAIKQAGKPEQIEYYGKGYSALSYAEAYVSQEGEPKHLAFKIESLHTRAIVKFFYCNENYKCDDFLMFDFISSSQAQTFVQEANTLCKRMEKDGNGFNRESITELYELINVEREAA